MKPISKLESFEATLEEGIEIVVRKVNELIESHNASIKPEEKRVCTGVMVKCPDHGNWCNGCWTQCPHCQPEENKHYVVNKDLSLSTEKTPTECKYEKMSKITDEVAKKPSSDCPYPTEHTDDWWEKQFDDTFKDVVQIINKANSWSLGYDVDIAIKNFIKNLLAQQREEIREKIEWKKAHLIYASIPKNGEIFTNGYNHALSDILAELKE